MSKHHSTNAVRAEQKAQALFASRVQQLQAQKDAELLDSIKALVASNRVKRGLTA